MADFTPGPWHVFASSYAASHHNSVEINNSEGLTVAWAQKFVPPYVSISEANARLIAEAPQMFEALECIQRDIRAGEDMTAHVESIDTLLRPIREQVRA